MQRTNLVKKLNKCIGRVLQRSGHRKSKWINLIAEMSTKKLKNTQIYQILCKFNCYISPNITWNMKEKKDESHYVIWLPSHYVTPKNVLQSTNYNFYLPQQVQLSRMKLWLQNSSSLNHIVSLNLFSMLALAPWSSGNSFRLSDPTRIYDTLLTSQIQNYRCFI